MKEDVMINRGNLYIRELYDREKAELTEDINLEGQYTVVIVAISRKKK